MKTLLAWSRQPTTVAGISALLATLAGLALGQLSFTQAVPLLIGAVVSAILPDNTQAKQEAENLSRDFVTQIGKK
jgi:ABC-type branched-subunit amino acid transport system permease subunit